MRPHWRQHKSPIAFRQLMLWRELNIEIGQLEAQLRQLPENTPPAPLLVDLVARLRADLFRLVSRETGARALQRPLPQTPDQASLAQSLAEARFALSRFREAHSSPHSNRDDCWLVRDD